MRNLIKVGEFCSNSLLCWLHHANFRALWTGENVFFFHWGCSLGVVVVNMQSLVGDVLLNPLWVSWLECSCYFSRWNKTTGNIFKESLIFTCSPGTEINCVHRKENLLKRPAVTWKDHFLFDSCGIECLERDFMVMCSLLIFFWIQMHEDQRLNSISEGLLEYLNLDKNIEALSIGRILCTMKLLVFFICLAAPLYWSGVMIVYWK